MKYLIFFILSTACTALLTPVVIYFAVRSGWVVKPRADRWHKKETPLLGGIAIALPAVLFFLFAAGGNIAFLSIIGCSFLMFLLGLADDFKGLTPQVKFIGQIIISALLISTGVVIEIIPYPVVSIPITFLWFLGLTNAFNLIDNMDGLSAGIAVISAFAIFVFSLQRGNVPLAFCSAALAGSCLGFLFYNFNPARIFMGDCGSMFLGFSLAAFSIAGTWKHASGLFVTLLVPVLILGIPIFDTAFVTVTRKLKGQPVSQGGRDHLSHRLVALGLTERKTVLLLYAVSAFFALAALFFGQINPFVFAAVSFIFLTALFYFCVFLGRSDKNVLKEMDNRDFAERSEAFLDGARRFSAIFVDLFLVVISYFLAYIIRFEGSLSQGEMRQFVITLPLVVIVKMAAFYYFGLYRTSSRHVGIRDFMNIAKAVFSSCVIVVFVILMISRFQFYSRTLFFIDAMLALILIGSAHFSQRLLREYLENISSAGRRVLIIGAGDGGDMLLREIKNNASINFQVMGFLDDDPHKQESLIQGVRVIGRVDDVEKISKKVGADEIIVAMPSVPESRVENIISLCRKKDLICRQFSSSAFFYDENKKNT